MVQEPSASARQLEIAAELGVQPVIDVAGEVERRVAFLTGLLTSSGAQALVLGISGGVDSAAAAALCRRAVDRSPGTQFIAVRLPYGQQRDDTDARDVLTATTPDRTLTVDIRAASDAALHAVLDAGLEFRDDRQQDFALGNIKARQRMVAQYAITGTVAGLVIGTDHAAEAVTGFYTKYGDGGVDAVPLSGLTKRQVRALAAHLGIPAHIVTKTPTADLETLNPGRSDEDALGLTYTQIDDFLEGHPTEPHVHDTLIAIHARTAHKRHMPPGP